MASSTAELSEEEIAAYRQFFWKQDTSGDGKLNLEEFQKMMTSMGMKLNPRQVRKAFTAADVDGGGYITFNEFAKTFLCKKDETTLTPKRLREVFYLVDKDRDGSLTKEECLQAFKMMHKNMNDEGITRVMQLMDKNKDGGINFDEFCRFMKI